MLPTGKRAADDAWTQGDRVRTALDESDDELCTQMVVTPTLPADCWGVVMEFALDRRTMATFGPGGVANKPCEYLPIRVSAATSQLYALRLVSRTWCRLASALVYTIMTPYGQLRCPQPPSDLATVFPNVRCIRVFTEKPAFIAPLVKTLEENAERRHGCPPPSGYRRVCVMNRYSCSSRARAIGESDMIFQQAVNPRELIAALTNADVVYVSGVYQNGWTRHTENTTFPLNVKAKIILYMTTSPVLLDILFNLLADVNNNVLGTICIYTPRRYAPSDIYEYCRYLGIQCLSQPNATSEEIEYAERQISAVHAVF